MIKHLPTVFFFIAIIQGCSLTSQRIQDGAYIVDSMTNKLPMQGLYLEAMVTKDEGGTFEVLAQTTTDENGYFFFDETYGSCFDCWENIYVYSDSVYTDTLGMFSYSFQDDLNASLVIKTDSFSLEHSVWLIPSIADLGHLNPDEMTINYTINLSSGTSTQNFAQPFVAGTTLPAVQITMDFGYQHWFTFGSGDVARAQLYNAGTEIGWGTFTLRDYHYTSEGDSLYIDFQLED